MKENQNINYAAWNVIYADRNIKRESDFFGVLVSDVENKIAEWMKEEDEKAGVFNGWDNLTKRERRIKIETVLGRKL